MMKKASLSLMAIFCALEANAQAEVGFSVAVRAEQAFKSFTSERTQGFAFYCDGCGDDIYPFLIDISDMVDPREYPCYLPNTQYNLPDGTPLLCTASSFVADIEVSYSGGEPCGQANVFFIDTLLGPAAVVDVDDFNRLSCGFGTDVFVIVRIPIFEVRTVQATQEEPPRGFSLSLSDIYTSSTSPLPLRWVGTSSLASPLDCVGCIATGDPVSYAAVVSNVSPPDEAVNVVMLDRKLCDTAESPPRAPDCLDDPLDLPGVGNGPHINATLPSAGVTIPPIFSLVRLQPLGRNQMHLLSLEQDRPEDRGELSSFIPNASLPVALTNESIDVALFPSSFAPGSMHVRLCGKRVASADDVSVERLDLSRATLNIDGVLGVPSDCETAYFDQALPTSTTEIHAVITPDVGLHFLWLEIEDDYTVAATDRLSDATWLMVRHPPVMYLHGWGTTGNVWGDLSTQLVNDGYIADRVERLYFVPYGDFDEESGEVIGPGTTRSISVYAHYLGGEIANNRRLSGINHVDLVGHSMGGVVQRYYDWASPYPYVRKIAYAGSPLHGSDLAVLASGPLAALLQATATVFFGAEIGTAIAGGVSVLLGDLRGDSVYDMQPHSSTVIAMNGADMLGGFPDAINPRERQRANQHTFVAQREFGNLFDLAFPWKYTLDHYHSNVQILFDPATWLWTAEVGNVVSPFLAPGGDTVVTGTSASLLGSPKTEFADTDGYRGPDLHMKFFKQAVVRNAIESFLRAPTDSMATTRMAAAPEKGVLAERTAIATPPGQFAQTDYSAVRIEPQSPDRSIQRDIVADGATEAIFVRVWAPTAGFTSTLIDPSGVPAESSAVVLDEHASGAVQFHGALLERAGRWRVEVEVSESDEAVNLVVQTSLGTNAQLGVALSSRFVRPGDRIVISSVSLGDAESVLLDPVARALGPHGEIIVPLWDDGSHGDVLAGDGWYMGILAGVPEAGHYSVVVGADQIVGGLRVHRSASVNFEAIIPMDLLIVDGSLRVDGGASVGGCSTVRARVRNDGEELATNVSLVLLEGDPEEGHEVSALSLDIPPGEEVTGELFWSPTRAGPTQLTLAIQPSPAFTEVLLEPLQNGDLMVRGAANNNTASVITNVVGLPVSRSLRIVRPGQISRSLPFVVHALPSPIGERWSVDWELRGSGGDVVSRASGMSARLSPAGIHPGEGTAVIYAAATPPVGAPLVQRVQVSVVDAMESFPGYEAPTAAFWGPQVLYSGVPAIFDGSLSSDNFGVATYRWSVSPGGSLPREASSALLSLPEGFLFPGDYTVRLDVTDAASMRGSASRSVQVLARPTSLMWLAEPVLAAGEVSTLELQLSDLSAICGPGRLSGFPVLVELTYEGGESRTSIVHTDAGGIARASIVPPRSGSYLLSASFAGSSQLAASATEVHEVEALDLAPPFVSVLGVEDGSTYDGPVQISVLVSDVDPTEMNVWLDGALVANGAVVGAPGQHELVVTATDASGNTTERQVGFRIWSQPQSRGLSLCAREDIHLANQAEVNSFDLLEAVTGQYGHVFAGRDLMLSNSAAILGDVAVRRDLVLNNDARITGDAYVGGTVTTNNQSKVEGSIFGLDPGESPCECNVDFQEAMTQARVINDNQLLVGNPYWDGHRLRITSRGKVVLHSGTYYLTELELSNQSELTVALGARVQIYVDGRLNIANSSRLNFPPASAASVWIGTSETGAISLSNSSENGYALYAPDARVDIANSSLLLGSVVGREIWLSNSGQISRRVGPLDLAKLALTCE